MHAVLIACVLYAADTLPDPFPIHRQSISPDQLAVILKKLPGGVLERMPRAKFEALVQAAARAEQSRKRPPRLVEARYTATLTAAPALSGTVQWKLRNPGAGPALLRLADVPRNFNLALRSPRFENREALLAEFPVPGGQPTPALLVDQPGDHTVTVDWSARVEARPDGLYTELRLPPCPAAVLELTLPDDCSLSGPDGATISGPHDSEKPKFKRWKVALGGRATLPLLIRRSSGRAPVVFVRQKTVHRLSPDGLVASHTLSAEALNGDVRELQVRHDPALRIVEVVGQDVEGWKAQPGAVLVKLRRPSREASFELKGLAPLYPHGQRGKPCAWTSPWAALHGAVSRGEKLELWLHPGLGVSAWAPGDFRLVPPSPSPGKDGVRKLSFLGGGIGLAGKPGGPAVVRRPSLSLEVGAVAFHVRQLVDWRISPDGMELTARLDYKMRQGRLFQIAVGLPAGWEPEAAEAQPEGMLHGWGVRGNMLLAKLARPLDGEASLLVRLRPSKAGPLVGRPLPLPLLVPVGARFHEGGLAIDYDEQAYRAAPAVSSNTAEPPAEGPWGGRMPGLYYPFLGNPPTGSLRLAVRPTRTRAQAEVTVSVDGGRAFQQTRLVLEAQSGRPGHVDLFISGPAGAPWRWQAEPPLRSVERQPAREVAGALAGLAARTPLSAAAFACRPRGTFWRLTFARPLVPRRPITLRSSRQLEPLGNGSKQRWEVALPAVLGASRMDGEVAVRLGGGEQASAEAGHLVEQPQQRRPGAWRSYRYSSAAARLVLEAWGGPSGTPEARIDEARLVTVLSADGTLRHRFSFRVWRWAGRQLPVQLPSGAQFVAATADGLPLQNVPVLEEEALLPVPLRAAPVRFELQYETEAGAGLWPRLTSPAPGLPITPPGLRRLWVLPSGVRPLLDGQAMLLPGPVGPTSPRMRAPADLLRLGPMLPLPGRPAGQASGHERAVIEAWTAAHNSHPGQKLSREALVRELAFDRLGAEHPLVVDAVALQRDEQKGPALFDELEAELLPTRSGALLTSRAQAEQWGGVVPADVESAARQAVESGREPSGRFASALEWLYRPEAPAEQMDAQEYLREGWTAWQPLAGAGTGDDLCVVHATAPAGGGAALALLLLVGLVLLWGASGGVRLRWLIAWLALSGLALAWLPTSLLDLARWPFIAGLLLLLPVLLTLEAGGETRRAPSTAGPQKPPSQLAAAVVLFIALSLGAATAQAPEAAKVYLLDGPNPAVFLTPEMKKRLLDVAKPDWLPEGGAALVSARYDGRMSGDVAEFDATFTVHSFNDERATVFIPLEGALLVGDVVLGDKQVLPVARGGPKPGYIVPAGDRGSHTLKMRFRVGVTGLGDEPGIRQARFRVPRLWQTQLVFQAPTGATYLHAPTRGGGQSVKPDPKGPILEAELGALPGPLTLRWYQENKAAAPKQTYREAYVWDLAAEGARLTAHVRYTLTGSVRALALDVPNDLEVVAVRARRPSGTTTEAPVRLSGWDASGGRLQLNFPVPVSGEVEVEVDFTLRGPLAGKAHLPLPRPQGVPAPGKSHLAYRAPGLAVNLSGEGLTGVARTRFAVDWPPASRPSLEGLAYASTFRRETPPRVFVAVQPQPSRFGFEQRITWVVGQRQAQLSARVVPKGPDAPVALEYDLGAKGVLITSVEGPSVSRWTQSGSALLVWLSGPEGAPIEMTGWVPLPPAKKGTPANFVLPCLRPLGGSMVRTELELLPEPGNVLVGQSVHPQLAKSAVPSRGLAYETEARAYGGAFVVRPGPVPTARVTTKAFVNGGAVRFESRVECQVPAQARSLTVRLRNWPGEAHLEAQGNTLLRQRDHLRRGPGRRERSWRLEPRPRVEKLVLLVRGSVPLEEAVGGVPMPEIQAGPGRQELSVGAGLVATAEGGLKWDGADKWHVAGPEWGMSLVPQAPSAGAPAEVLLQRVRATVPDGQRWLHEVTWWLRQDGPAELRLKRPEGALVGLEVDGVPFPVEKQRGEIALALPPTSRPRKVRLLYRRDPGRESLSRPDLAAPELKGVKPGPVVWSAEVPPGWELSGPSTPWLPPAVGRAAQALYRARADGGGPHVREAELALKAAGPELGPIGPELTRLYSELKSRAGEMGKPAQEGGSARWATKEATPPPVVRLASLAARRPEQAVLASLQWLGLGLALWAVSLSSWLRTAGRWLWPELLVALGLIGWYFNGPVLAPVVLMVFGGVARLVLLYLGAMWLLGAGETRSPRSTVG
jgi:hypothetical protein